MIILIAVSGNVPATRVRRGEGRLTRDQAGSGRRSLGRTVMSRTAFLSARARGRKEQRRPRVRVRKEQRSTIRSTLRRHPESSESMTCMKCDQIHRGRTVTHSTCLTSALCQLRGHRWQGPFTMAFGGRVGHPTHTTPAARDLPHLPPIPARWLPPSSGTY